MAAAHDGEHGPVGGDDGGQSAAGGLCAPILARLMQGSGLGGTDQFSPDAGGQAAFMQTFDDLTTILCRYRYRYVCICIWTTRVCGLTH